jgi:hypothetical protein
MGIADVRNAFVDAGQDKLRCTAARLRYAPDGNNSQILEFDGHYDNGTSFSVSSGPFDPNTKPQEKAREMARQLLK